MTLRTHSLLTLGAAGLVLAVTAVGGGIVYAGQLLPAPARDRTLDVWATVTGRGTVLLPPDRRAYLNQGCTTPPWLLVSTSTCSVLTPVNSAWNFVR